MTEIVAAIADDPLRNAIRAAKVGADMIEIRIDLLDYPADSLHSLFKQLNKSVGIPIIATNRIDVEGGKFDGSEEERIEILLSVLEMVDSIDIELRTRSEYRDLVVHRAKKAGKRVIISYHDFSFRCRRRCRKTRCNSAFVRGCALAPQTHARLRTCACTGLYHRDG